MPTFVNRTRHRAYAESPDTGLVRLLADEEVDASGVFADNLENTPGVYVKGSKADKEAVKANDGVAENLENFGPHAFPATDDEPSGPSPAEKGEKAEGDLLTDDQREARAGKSSGGTVTSEDTDSGAKRKSPCRKTSAKSSS